MNVIAIELDANKDSETLIVIDLVFMAIMVLFSIYFLRNELIQLWADGFSYFLSGWNHIDIVPPIAIIILVFLRIFDDGKVVVDDKGNELEHNDHMMGAVQSIATFFMWMKFLYFFRFFESTGYLIRMIVEVTYEMRSFIFILLITIIALGDSMLSIAHVQRGENTLPITNFFEAAGYSYEIAIGGFDTGSLGDEMYLFVYILFLVNTIFNTIVMLNLLIAIMMEAYTKIASDSVGASYQGKCNIIVENAYLIPDQEKKDLIQNGKYMIVAINKTPSLEDQSTESLCKKIIEQNENIIGLLKGKWSRRRMSLIW